MIPQGGRRNNVERSYINPVSNQTSNSAGPAIPQSTRPTNTSYISSSSSNSTISSSIPQSTRPTNTSYVQPSFLSSLSNSTISSSIPQSTRSRNTSYVQPSYFGSSNNFSINTSIPQYSRPTYVEPTVTYVPPPPPPPKITYRSFQPNRSPTPPIYYFPSRSPTPDFESNYSDSSSPLLESRRKSKRVAHPREDPIKLAAPYFYGIRGSPIPREQDSSTCCQVCTLIFVVIAIIFLILLTL